MAEQVPMAGKTKEVEDYLLTRLEEAIQQTNKDDHSITKLFGFPKGFEDLKAIILQPKHEPKRRETLYHLINLLSEWQMITKKHGFHKPESICASYKLNERLKKIKKDLKGGGGESTTSLHTAGTPEPQAGEQQQRQSFPDNFDSYRWSTRFRPKRVHGLDDKIRFLERLIVRKESEEGLLKALAIVGIMGVGKTALCQVMFNNEQVKKYYDLRLWVCLSRQAGDDEDSKREAVKRILMCLGVEEEVIIKLAGPDTQHHGLRMLIFALRLQLMGKKYLLVLDDASSEDKFFENLPFEDDDDSNKQDTKLAHGLPKVKGSMVIVTTRSEELANKMVGEHNVHNLPLLKNKQLCWEIFKDAVEKQGEPTLDGLEALKDLVVKKCGGLPLSATMMGKIMRQTHLQDNNKAAH